VMSLVLRFSEDPTTESLQGNCEHFGSWSTSCITHSQEQRKGLESTSFLSWWPGNP